MIIEILSSALLALMTTSAWAQENDTKTDEWAPKDHVKISFNAGPQWNSSLGCLAGVDVHIPLGQSRWGFEPGLYWSFRNHTEEQTENNDKEEYNDKVHYLEVPLHFPCVWQDTKMDHSIYPCSMVPILPMGLTALAITP